MKSWCKVLPFIFIEWWAKKKCEKLTKYTGILSRRNYVSPFKDVEFYINEEPCDES